MSMLQARSTPQRPWLALLIAAPLAYAVVVRAPLLALLLLLAALACLIPWSLLDRSAARGIATAVCALVIVYPALAPRPATGRLSVVAGGDFDTRARSQLIALLALLGVSLWLWLSVRGSVAIFARLPFALFAAHGAVIVFSLAYTPDKAWAAYAALKLFQAILILATLTVVVRTVGQLRRVFDVTLVAVVLVLLFYGFDILTGVAVLNSEARWTTNWLAAPNASILAGFFTCIVGVRFFAAPSWRVAVAAGVLTGGGALAGLIIGGKSALGAAFVALLLAVAVLALRGSSVARQVLILRLMLVGGGLLLIGVAVALANIGLAAHLRAYDANPYIDAATLTGRVPVWATAIREGLQSPWFGHGYMSTFALGLDGGRSWIAPQAHNAFIQTFFDLGFLGLLPVVLLYGAAWWCVTRQVLAFVPSDARWPLAVELLAALTMLTLVSLTEDIYGGIFESRTMLFMLVVVAIHHNARLEGLRPAATASPQPARRQSHVAR